MPRYFYKAKNLKGREENGVIEAGDKKQLANILRKKGYFLLSVEGDGKQKKRNPLKTRVLEMFVGVPLAQKLFFTKNLEVMIKTGVPLPRAFMILSKQTKSKKFKTALEQVSESVIKGRSLSEALGAYPKIFSRLYCETLRVGEETGKLEDALHILGEQMAKEHDLKSRIKTAMVYPIVVLCMAVLIGVFMMVFAVPKIKEAFEDLNLNLPLTTRAMLGMADFLTHRWPIALILIIALVFAVVSLLKTSKGSKAKSFLVLKFPIISGISKKTNSALALRILSSLIKAGVPIVRALDIASGALGNYYFKESLANSSKIVQKGKKISETLQPYENLYSPMVLQMLEIGEETGETSEVLAKLADFYESEVIAATEKLSSIIEPVLILLIGGVVGFFAVSMMQPMFSMMGGM